MPDMNCVAQAPCLEHLGFCIYRCKHDGLYLRGVILTCFLGGSTMIRLRVPFRKAADWTMLYTSVRCHCWGKMTSRVTRLKDTHQIQGWNLHWKCQLTAALDIVEARMLACR